MGSCSPLPYTPTHTHLPPIQTTATATATATTLPRSCTRPQFSAAVSLETCLTPVACKPILQCQKATLTEQSEVDDGGGGTRNHLSTPRRASRCSADGDAILWMTLRPHGGRCFGHGSAEVASGEGGAATPQPRMMKLQWTPCFAACKPGANG